MNYESCLKINIYITYYFSRLTLFLISNFNTNQSFFIPNSNPNYFIEGVKILVVYFCTPRVMNK